MLVMKYICPLVAAYRAESGEPSTYCTYVEWTDESPARPSFPLTVAKQAEDYFDASCAESAGHATDRVQRHLHVNELTTTHGTRRQASGTRRTESASKGQRRPGNWRFITRAGTRKRPKRRKITPLPRRCLSCAVRATCDWIRLALPQQRRYYSELINRLTVAKL